MDNTSTYSSPSPNMNGNDQNSNNSGAINSSMYANEPTGSSSDTNSNFSQQMYDSPPISPSPSPQESDVSLNSLLNADSNVSMNLSTVSPSPSNLSPVESSKNENQTTSSLSLPATAHENLSFKEKIIDATPLLFTFICVGFLIFVQNLAQTCRRFCQTDSCLSNSIMSGASLGYLFSKVFPHLVILVQNTHQVDNIYFKKTEHILLAVFFLFGMGFLQNYFFEKKTARNIVENVEHSKGLYTFNMSILVLISFFCGFHVLTFLTLGVFEMMEFTFFISLLLYSENSTLCNLFQGANTFFRRVVLSIAMFVGFFASKLSLLSVIPLLGVLSESFILGFFVFTTMRVEMALVKRNSNYTAFIISFIGLCALTIIQSLYESVRC
jgi:hypothetical protein